MRRARINDNCIKKYYGPFRERAFRKRMQKGLTLIEILVVVAIVGVLAALLLVAVQPAREAARRVSCQNNLRQMGLGLLNYEEARKQFPPSSVWKPGVSLEGGNNPQLSENWVTLVLPFVEQMTVYEAFNLDDFTTADSNALARAARVGSMLCPTDQFNRQPFNGSANVGTNNLGDGWARGNYAANGSLGFLTQVRHGWQSAGVARNWSDVRLRGVMGANTSIGIRQITDGASKTVLLGEIRAGVTAFDSRGVWAMSGACPSSLWAHGYIGDDNGPNAATLDADDVQACNAVRNEYGGAAALARLGMSCSGGDWENSQQTMRSLHHLGVFSVFADGSVRWISDYVERGVGGSLGVWDRVNLSGDGQTVSAEDL